jgi:Negative regulator of sigma F
MSKQRLNAAAGYRDQIVGTLTPVRPLSPPSRRVLMLLPLGGLLAAIAPLLAGVRGDLAADAPLLTWGITAAQSLIGLWLLALGFREAVPGRNLSPAALGAAMALTTGVVTAVTLVTNAASATVVPAGRALEYWAECVGWPLAFGAPFMVLATLMATRAFPIRPAIAGALCGASAGMLSDAGWRLTCWISAPAHVAGAHGLAILALTAAGSLLALCADIPRWRMFR